MARDMARLTMNIPDELLQVVDTWASHYGVTRTAYITMALSQKVQSEEVTMALPEMQRMLNELNDLVRKGETKKGRRGSEA